MSKFIEVLGAPGTGKTTLLYNQIARIIDKTQSKALVVDPGGKEPVFDHVEEIDITDPKAFLDWDIGFRKVYYDKNETFEYLYNYMEKHLFVNAHLVLMDAAVYCRGNIEKSLARVILRRRNKNLYIWSEAHGISQIPPVLFTYIDQYIFFRTKDNPERRKELIANYDDLMKVKQYADQQGLKNPHFCCTCTDTGQMI